MRMTLCLMFSLLAILPERSYSGVYTNQMSDCLVKSTTGQERIDLVRWIVLAYSKHPDVASFVHTDEAIDVGIQMKTAELFTSLLLVRCLEEAQNAVREEGDKSLEEAFSVLGQVAAFELMRDEHVNASVMEFLNYLDEKSFDLLFE